VLHRLAAQRLIQLDRLVGGDTILILRALRADPVEDVALERVVWLLPPGKSRYPLRKKVRDDCTRQEATWFGYNGK